MSRSELVTRVLVIEDDPAQVVLLQRLLSQWRGAPLVIEAALTAYEGRVYAIEVDPEGVAICRENVQTFGADNVRVIDACPPSRSISAQRNARAS